MYRTAALILALAAIVFFAVRSGEEPVRALQKPEVRLAPEGLGATRGPDAERESAAATSKIGIFETPGRVPDYDVLEVNSDERDGARGAAPNRLPLA